MGAMRHKLSAILVCVGTVSIAVSCTRQRVDPPAASMANLSEDEETAPNIQLPAVPIRSVVHPKGCARVQVGARLQTEGFDLPLSGGRVSRTKRDDYLIEPLRDALQAHPLRRSECMALRADARTPHRTVIEVLYTAGQAGITEIWLVTKGRDGLAAFELHLPRLIAAVEGELHQGNECRQMQGSVRAAETWLHVERSRDSWTAELAAPDMGAGSDGLKAFGDAGPGVGSLGDAFAAEPDAGASIAGTPGSEPTPVDPPPTSANSSPDPPGGPDPYPSTIIAYSEGTPNFYAIVDWLRATHGKDACETGIVSAADTLSWGDVCRVLGAFSATGIAPVLAIEQ